MFHIFAYVPPWARSSSCVPLSAIRPFSSIFLLRRYSAIGSRALEGSSSIAMSDFLAKTLAIAAFCASPPESVTPYSENSFVSFVWIPPEREDEISKLLSPQIYYMDCCAVEDILSLIYAAL